MAYGGGGKSADPPQSNEPASAGHVVVIVAQR
jgi:hypothetical protein